MSNLDQKVRVFVDADDAGEPVCLSIKGDGWHGDYGGLATLTPDEATALAAKLVEAADAARKAGK